MDIRDETPWKIKKAVFLIAMASAIAAGATLRIANLDNVSRRSPDERVYAIQAGVISTQGVQGVRSLVTEHAANKALWIYPPPIRVGYTALLAVAMKATGVVDTRTGSYVSAAFSIVSLFILALIGLRFFGPVATLYALLFLAVSPMDIAIARRAWQDSVIGCLGLLAVYFSCEIIRNPRRYVWHALFAATGCCCMLVKESGLIIVALCTAWVLAVLILREKQYKPGLVLVVSSLIGALMSLAAIAYAAGGVRPVLDVFMNWQSAVPTNQYAIDYQTGPWWHFFHGFWIVSPLSFTLCLVGVAGAFLAPGIDRRVSLGMVFFTAVLLSSAVITPCFQNLRYVSAAFAPFYLVAGLGLSYLLSLAGRVLGRPLFNVTAVVVAAFCIVFAATDYQTFQKIFIRNGAGIIDTSIKLIRDASR